ncbi:hydantoinase/carbamoylase family amidase [Pararhizobium sp. YC-54]|uniref:hydantoinase/carbamoylase family amidase n=1 Tax=Pararhizobium sp. YC-54 TaxID=2986920 RepID=UPI0021F6EE6C|nr:hydantoinase/carbamoylase family amidase [Pararhizobium sp. YC-54]MCV9999359.1 hydantoinase/carbamoylase family amidase [Pararhizobium sp. YC-54]
MGVDRALCEALFDELRQKTFDGVGITRDSYGHGESLALDVIERAAAKLGLAVERDRGANLVITLPGTAESAEPCIAFGSHLDSVPQGGNFDGAAGVVAGLAVLASFLREGFKPKRALKLFALRGEESARFGKAYIGSSALFGKLSQDDLDAPAVDSGRKLSDCMSDVGVDVERVHRGEALVDPRSIGAWLELHIEQGPVLIARQQAIGIVTGIRGNFRHRNVECVGEAGHSGAVPRWLRHDAVFASAELLVHIDRHWRTLLERGRDLVVTSGIFGTVSDEHAIARIPGTTRFSFEVRSQHRETLEAFYDLFQSECASVAEERGVNFKFDRLVESAPALMDSVWINRLIAAAGKLGHPCEEMASGAGHDAAVFANAGIPSAMIFVRNSNGSHNPNEAMDIDDFLVGVHTMREAIREAAQ